MLLEFIYLKNRLQILISQKSCCFSWALIFVFHHWQLGVKSFKCPYLKKAKQDKPPILSLGQGWQVKLTSRLADEHSATLPVFATPWTQCSSRTFALNNLQSVKFHSSFQGNDMFLVFSLSAAQCCRNCATKQREALWTQWGEDPLITRKRLLYRRIEILPSS